MDSVFVVADTTIYREGIVSFLAKQPGIDVIGSAARPNKSIGDHDLCVLDLAGQLDHTVALFFAAMRDAGTSVVVVGLPGTQQDVLGCLQAGASGYVTKEQSLGDLCRVVRQTLSTGACVRESDVSAMLSHFRSCGSNSAKAKGGTPSMVLTKRERQVARLLSDSRSNGEIARELGISVHTVKHHVQRTLLKLGMERRGEASALRGRIDSFVD